MRYNVAYLRVSTEAQTEKYGLDVQKQKILDYCEKNGVKIDRWYVDGGYSGSKLDRPEIQKLLDDAENGLIGTVYIYKLDRMSRDVIDTLNLIYRILPKYGVQVVSMSERLETDSPIDKVMLTVNAAMNQYEREIIRLRMSAGMVERVKKGLWMGGGRVPLGYYYDRNDGILHPKEDEADKIRQAYKLYLEGVSTSAIATLLGFKGDVVVTNILKRKSNIGYIEYKGKTYKGLHEPIVDEDTFYAVQRLMTKRSTNSHLSDNNLLTGLCYCGKCGARLRYQKWGSYHKLVCYSQQKGHEYMRRDPNCTNAKVRAKAIEDEVESCFKEFAINVKRGSETKDNSAAIEALIKKSNAKIKKLYNLYAENDSDNLLSVIKDEEERLKELNKQLEIERTKDLGKNDKLEEIKRVSEIWDTLTPKEKNRILKYCIEKVVITDDDIDIYFVTM